MKGGARAEAPTFRGNKKGQVDVYDGDTNFKPFTSGKSAHLLDTHHHCGVNCLRIVKHISIKEVKMKKYRFVYAGENIAGTTGTTVTAHVIAHNRKHAKSLVGSAIMSKDPSIVLDKKFDISQGVVYWESSNNSV